MDRYEITDPQWERMAHLLPGKVGYVGRSAVDNRLLINRPGELALLWVTPSGETCPNVLARGNNPTSRAQPPDFVQVNGTYNPDAMNGWYVFLAQLLVVNR